MMPMKLVMPMMLDADDVSVDKNLGVFSHLESGLFFFSLFFFHFFRVGTL